MTNASVLDFIGRVNIAVREVTEKYPQAQLYEAISVAADHKAVTDPIHLDTLKVVFRTPGSASLATVTIKSKGYASFDAPEFVDEPWLEDYIISWPIEMTAEQANTLKQAAGYREAYHSLTLRSPLGPHATRHPYFIFGDKSGDTFVFVDAVTKEVFTSK
jgi:hypothetical protein